MPTANTTSAKSTKPRVKATRKAAGAKAAGSRHASASASRPRTQSKATRAKASRTRATHQAEATVDQARRASRQARTASRDTATVFGDYAERAVLIQVGAALTARDRVVSGVGDTLSNYRSSSKAQAQLRRFERRGSTARNRLEREVRKARVQVERRLRKSRRDFGSTVKDLDERRESFTKSSSDLANRVPELADRVQERILSLV